MQVRTEFNTFNLRLIILFVMGLSACNPAGNADNPGSNAVALPSPSQTQKYDSVSLALAERLKSLCRPVGGTVGISAIQVETGRSVNVESDRQLPLYSAFKLPLAVSVLKDVEEDRLRLDTKVRVTPAEVVPGWRGNTDRWRNPGERTIMELLKFSIVQSDNTSSDKLLQLVGGPEAVTRRLRALGYANIDIRSSVREYVNKRENVNTGSAADLAKLLAQLQSGQILKPPQKDLLMQFMREATTGARRLRGDLPPGTPVADKTGTGERGLATNDVGIITLPEGRGHIAIAVLVSGSNLPEEQQEKLIAEAARMLYDAYVEGPLDNP